MIYSINTTQSPVNSKRPCLTSPGKYRLMGFFQYKKATPNNQGRLSEDAEGDGILPHYDELL
ncbi:MAG: hypothetical protein Q4C00_07095 [Bacillota bacterium]|nr:hypothetical protein [Bacillota bacterium]